MDSNIDGVEYAGFLERFLALLIDFLLLLDIFILWLVLDALGIVFKFQIWLLIGIIYIFFYFTILTASRLNGTLGKWILKMKVTDLELQKISYFRSFNRFLASIISSQFLFIGYLIQPFTKKHQTFHDIIAGTLVVKSDGQSITLENHKIYKNNKTTDFLFQDRK